MQEELNEKQLKVVKELDRNILLIASAGTGKTNTLVYRLTEIIKCKRALPQEILCLTFTNKACDEMQKRVTTLLGASADKIDISTFHSFCYEIVKAEAKKNSDLFMDFTIFDEDDCMEIVRSINTYGVADKSLQDFINLVKQYRAVYGYYTDDAHADYRQVGEQLFAHEMAKIDAVCETAYHHLDKKMKEIVRVACAQIVERYNKLLADMHGLDFVDLIVKADELLLKPTVVKIWQHKYKYLNIDEVQDTSLLEYRILSRLFASNNILLCGDYFQTIYQWRGSNPQQIIEQYKKVYAPLTVIFDRNYRATQTLLAASYDCLRNLLGAAVDKVYAEALTAAAPITGAKIVIKKVDDAKAEAGWIFAQISKLRDTDLSKICILTRSNRYNERLSIYLADINKTLPHEKQINFILVDQFKFFRRQEIKDVLAFLKLLLNRHDLLSLKRILTKFVPGIGEKTMAELQSTAYREVGISLTDFLDKRVYGVSADPFADLLTALPNENLVIFDVESTGTDIATDEIVQIAAVKLDAAGKVKEKFMQLLKPDKKVGTSFFVHGFSDEYLAQNGKSAKDVISDFLQFVMDAVIVGHNVSYDIDILTNQIDRLQLARPKFAAVYDTLDIYRRFYPNLANHKLGFLSDYFSIEDKPTHDAFDDVLATASLLLHALQNNIVPTAKMREEYIRKHLVQFRQIAMQINELAEDSKLLRPYEIIAKIMNVTRIKEFYSTQPERINRIRELYLIARHGDNEAQKPRASLVKFIKMAALSNNEMDRMIAKVPRVPLITVHQSKGSEFDYVFLAGMQEGIFPSFLAVREGNLTEEKRLFYVALTRAKRKLFISWSNLSEHHRKNKISSFLAAIPTKYKEDI